MLVTLDMSQFESAGVFSDQFSEQFDVPLDPSIVPDGSDGLHGGTTPEGGTPEVGGGEFSGEYGDEFAGGGESGGGLPIIPMLRPRRPKEGLWKRLAHPLTPYALLLHMDGSVLTASSMTDPRIHDADHVIIGGTLFISDDTSWQAVVLRAAGFQLKEYTS